LGLLFTEVANLIPRIFALWANEPVSAGPPPSFIDWFPTVRTASFSAKNTFFECEGFCLGHCCPPYVNSSCGSMVGGRLHVLAVDSPPVEISIIGEGFPLK
jgi:hypothetical protein